jgi:hypothetical protein
MFNRCIMQIELANNIVQNKFLTFLTCLKATFYTKNIFLFERKISWLF